MACVTNAVQVTGGTRGLASARPAAAIVGAVHQRLESLSGRARHLLATAAVLGSSFRLEDAADMLAQTPATLLPVVQEAMDAGIMTAGGRRVHVPPPAGPPRRRRDNPAAGPKALHRQYARSCSPAANRRRAPPATCSRPPIPVTRVAGRTGPGGGADPATSPQTAADWPRGRWSSHLPAIPARCPALVAAAEAITAAGRVGQAARIARDPLARPLPAVEEDRLRCVLAWVLCASGRARDACDRASLVLARPQLPGDLRDQAMTAQLRALAGMPADRRPAAWQALSSPPRDHGNQVIAAAPSPAP